MRWGGDLRRRYIFDALIRRTGATSVHSWSRSDVSRALDGRRFWERKPRFAAAEIVSNQLLELIRREAHASAVDLHDEPVSGSKALGMPLDEAVARQSRETWVRNVEFFPNLIVQTRAFADFCGLESARTIVAPNGTDTTHIVATASPDEPTVGFVSGAGPNRGVETLIEAARMLRSQIPDLRLALWLVGTGAASQRYLDDLKVDLASDRWILVGTVRYNRLARSLSRASVLCIPHPPDPYFDIVLPVKLADSMAAGRPVVVTPRTETAAVVRRYDAGLVAGGERPEDLAVALLAVLSDHDMAARLGANGRRAAEQHFDWSVIGGRLADALLARVR
jgi:glycosyltransferase involved in cell wall biosynthesis